MRDYVTDFFGGMHSFRHRFEQLAHQLDEFGYRFENTPIGSPDPDLKAKLDRINRSAAPVPAALAAFYEVVGSLNFLGEHPQWSGCDYPDAVVVDPIDAVLVELDMWLEQIADIGPTEAGPFLLPIAPDSYHKANVSGGMFYNVPLPSKSHDPIIAAEPHGLSFTRYLDCCLAWGGFPGLEQSSQHTWPLERLRAAIDLH